MNYNEARFKANANHDDGSVPWHNDPSGRPFKSNLDKPLREILAFGCDRHVQGGAVCVHWCGQDKCGVTLAEPAATGVLVAYGSLAPRPPCTVCGTPAEKHGSYPTCASHPYTPDSMCQHVIGAACVGVECRAGCVRGRGTHGVRGGAK